MMRSPRPELRRHRTWVSWVVPSCISAPTTSGARIFQVCYRVSRCGARVSANPAPGPTSPPSRRVRASDGDGWRITGQKIWTSDAAWADRCLLLARTDAEASRHRGISVLVANMHQSGIEVRPIVAINGDREFNEVFFDGAFVPGTELVGELGQGWEIAMTTVGYERGPTDVGFSSRYGRTIRALEHQAIGRELTPPEASHACSRLRAGGGASRPRAAEPHPPS